MKQLVLFNLILLASILAQGQCAYQQYHKFGYRATSFKILEDLKGSNVFVFYDATIDTNSIDGQDDYEIWIIKNDSCGNRLWKKHFGFEDSVSYDNFTDAIYTSDSCLLILGYGEYTDQGGGRQCHYI